MRVRSLFVFILILACQGSEPANRAEYTPPDVVSENTTASISPHQNSAAKTPASSRSRLADKTREVIKTKKLSEYTSADFTRLATAVSQCSALSEIELKRCSHYQTILRLLAHKNAPTGHRRFLMSSVGNRLLDHESAAVRWLAARLLKSIAQVEPSSRQNLVERLAVEKTPLVIATLMQILGYFVAESASLKTTFIALAEHQSPDIRGLAVSRLTQLDLSNDEALRTLLENKLDTDPSAAVGKAVCLQLGQRPTDDGLARMGKIIGNRKHVANEVCLVALVSTWVAPSLPALSEKGFRMTLDIINERLKNKIKLPWSVIARLAQGGHLVSQKKLNEDNVRQLNEMLTQFVHAPEQNIQARVVAVQALNTFAADQSLFKDIVERYQLSAEVDYQLAARAKAYLGSATTEP